MTRVYFGKVLVSHVWMADFPTIIWLAWLIQPNRFSLICVDGIDDSILQQKYFMAQQFQCEWMD